MKGDRRKCPPLFAAIGDAVLRVCNSILWPMVKWGIMKHAFLRETS
jgi:hypothetical protein